MSHTQMRHVSHTPDSKEAGCIKESCHIWMSHVIYEWVMSHMNESCQTHKWVMSHTHPTAKTLGVCMSPVSHMNRSCHTWMIHVTHMHKSCHIRMSHVTYEWVMPHMNVSCHKWLSHVTHEWVVSRHCDSLERTATYQLSHVAQVFDPTTTHWNSLQLTATHINESCHAEISGCKWVIFQRILTWLISAIGSRVSMNHVRLQHTLQHTATHPATHCNTLQLHPTTHPATSCNTLQHTATCIVQFFLTWLISAVGIRAWTSCVRLQHILQHTATHCNTLQHIL